MRTVFLILTLLGLGWLILSIYLEARRPTFPRYWIDWAAAFTFLAASIIGKGGSAFFTSIVAISALIHGCLLYRDIWPVETDEDQPE